MRRVVIGLLFLASVSRSVAALTPLTVKEVSLMLRSGYSSEVVLQELSKRKFADALDSNTEKQLIQAGASQSLISTLESGVYQLSAAETQAVKEKQKPAAQGSNDFSSDSNTIARNQTPPTSTPTPPDGQAGGSMYDHLKDDLVYWHEGSLVPFDDEALQGKKFYLLFFSAFWSREGRQFTPRLVDYYNRVAPTHPEFEVIFFSADRSAYAMESYISQNNMPWPVLAYEKRGGKAGGIAENLVHQIPCLVLADASGKILSRSGESQTNPDKVLADLDKVLAGN